MKGSAKELREIQKIRNYLKKKPCLKPVIKEKGLKKFNAGERTRLNYVMMYYCHCCHDGTLPTTTTCKKAVRKYLQSSRTQGCMDMCFKNKAARELIIEFISDACDTFCHCNIDIRQTDEQIGGSQMPSIGEVGDFAEKVGISDVTKAVAKEIAADQIRENAISGAIAMKALNGLVTTSGQFFQ